MIGLRKAHNLPGSARLTKTVRPSRFGSHLLSKNARSFASQHLKSSFNSLPKSTAKPQLLSQTIFSSILTNCQSRQLSSFKPKEPDASKFIKNAAGSKEKHGNFAVKDSVFVYASLPLENVTPLRFSFPSFWILFHAKNKTSISKKKKKTKSKASISKKGNQLSKVGQEAKWSKFHTQKTTALHSSKFSGSSHTRPSQLFPFTPISSQLNLTLPISLLKLTSPTSRSFHLSQSIEFQCMGCKKHFPRKHSRRQHWARYKKCHEKHKDHTVWLNQTSHAYLLETKKVSEENKLRWAQIMKEREERVRDQIQTEEEQWKQYLEKEEEKLSTLLKATKGFWENSLIKLSFYWVLKTFKSSFSSSESLCDEDSGFS